MIIRNDRRRGRDSLLTRYANQMGTLVERRLSEAALMAAKQAAERAAAQARQAMAETEAVNRLLREEIEQRVRAQDDLEHLATHDPLTDLPNRALFLDRLNRAIEDCRRRERILAVMFIDLDHFKDVNDTLGHGAGDQLLRAVGERLRACVRGQDTVARLGGDEFGVIQVDLPSAEAARVQASRILDALALPYDVYGHRIFSGASIGITVFPRDADSAGELQKNADLAMYRAKGERRNSFHFFDAELNEVVHRRTFLETELRFALAREQLRVYYQPKMHVRSGRLAGAEALLRWHHDSGIIPPSEFVPLAERSGLIVDIGEWVLRTACCQFKKWHDRGHRLSIAVNLSAAQFKSSDIPATVAAVLRDTGFDPRWLELELTESTVMHDVRDAVNVLSQLRRLGLSISIDDFGTGYSSLSYLRELPLDRLKIDRSFIADVDTKETATAIARAVVSLGRSLGLQIVAEGAENERHMDFLRHIDCDEVQGYYFGRPMPAEEFERFMLKDAEAAVA